MTNDPSFTIRRRCDGSIDTDFYVKRGNRLHREAIRNSLGVFRRGAHAVAAWMSTLRRKLAVGRDTAGPACSLLPSHNDMVANKVVEGS